MLKKYEELPIGIDLGTTFSCIGVYRNSKVEIIPNEIGDRTTPSIVSFIDNDIFVGEQNEYKILKDPKNKIYAVKRIIGRNYDDKEVQEDLKHFSYKVISNLLGNPVIEVNSNGIKRYSPEQISAKILAKLKQSAESFLGQNIHKVVITVPAYFTERQKQATKNAGEIAGLEVIKIINEPTAASLAYGFGKCTNDSRELIDNDFNIKKIFKSLEKNPQVPVGESKNKEGKNILVFDLGGGTLDVTLLELEEEDITVKSHSGIMHLGGEDFDNQIVQYCINKFKEQTRIDLNEPEFLKQKKRLKEHCEKAKRKLSLEKEAEIEVESLAKGKDFYIKLTKAKFEELCKDLFEKCKIPIDEVLKDSKCQTKNVDEIVLVGGSTRIPKIQEMLKDYFDGKELNCSLNCDEAIAYGATIEAALQMGKYLKDVTLLDVCPFSLGIAVVTKKNEKSENMLMSTIIQRGSKLPCKKTEIFNPASDYQKAILLKVYEGEKKYVKDNYLLGQFELINLPSKPSTEVELEVTFDLNEDSILTVTAVERDNKSNWNSITIKNDKGGLSKNEIEEAKIKEKEENKGNDLENIMIIERNYKKEINLLYKKIKTLTEPLEQYLCLLQMKNYIEKLINSFDRDNINNDTLREKLYYYLKHLFNIYSVLLNFSNLISIEEKDDIFCKTKDYLYIFEKNGISYGSSLVHIFKDNEIDLFADFCIQILGFYSRKATDCYFNREKKIAKHILEEALSIIKRYSIKEKIENKNDLIDSFKPINLNINEILNILKAESIEKCCKSFSKDILIREDEFTTEDEKLNILDKFKEALAFLKNPRRSIDKLLKAMYLANIAKIEYKMFNSSNYFSLLKMIEECINLKESIPRKEDDNGCYTPVGDKSNEIIEDPWYKEICSIKLEIEHKKEHSKENPEEQENKIKEGLIDIFAQLNDYYKKGRIEFLFYILKNHRPNGLEKNYIFESEEKLKEIYYQNPNKFVKKLRKYYNPIRYKGDKEEDKKACIIMQEILKFLNEFD